MAACARVPSADVPGWPHAPGLALSVEEPVWPHSLPSAGCLRRSRSRYATLIARPHHQMRLRLLRRLAVDDLDKTAEIMGLLTPYLRAARTRSSLCIPTRTETAHEQVRALVSLPRGHSGHLLHDLAASRCARVRYTLGITVTMPVMMPST